MDFRFSYTRKSILKFSSYLRGGSLVKRWFANIPSVRGHMKYACCLFMLAELVDAASQTLRTLNIKYLSHDWRVRCTYWCLSLSGRQQTQAAFSFEVNYIESSLYSLLTSKIAAWKAYCFKLIKSNFTIQKIKVEEIFRFHQKQDFYQAQTVKRYSVVYCAM